MQSADILQAKRQLSGAERSRDQGQDQWKSRLSGNNQLSFEQQTFPAGGRDNNSNRTSNSSGTFTQLTPTGTSLEVSAQKFWEIQNPLFSALDRRYSAKITQDIFRNAFGKTQRAQSKQAGIDYEVAELVYRQSLVQTCETAFNIYSDAFIQQEIVELLHKQYKDAQKALKVSRKLYKDKLINKIDKLNSESDFINVQLQYEQAQQRLLNTKLQIQAFLKDRPALNFQLFDPSGFLNLPKVDVTNKTLSQVIIEKRVKSQEFGVEQARADRWTDVQVGVEVGERFGRLNVGGPLLNYEEEYLTANISFGFDLINNTEDATLRNAITVKNNLVIQNQVTEKTQQNLLTSLTSMDALLKEQVKSSEQQVKLLKEKMDIAFTQMQKARIDFQTYLLHRNAYLNQKQNYLRLKQDLWKNQFSLQKEFAHTSPLLCEVKS